MYTRLSELKNLKLSARDGDIGRCRDFLFDDQHWAVRYLEVNTSRWLLGRRVLLSPASVGVPDPDDGVLPVDLTKDEIKSAPGLEEHQPVSRQYEAELARHYGHTYYWAGIGVWGVGAFPVDILQTEEIVSPTEATHADEADEEAHLRSAAEVTGYRIHAVDGEIGEVEDFIVEVSDWTIAFAALDTRKWLPGRKVLLPISWATRISWAENSFTVDVSKQAIETAPALHEPITEEAVAAYFRHFGK